MLYAFALGNNISGQVLYRMHSQDCCYVVWPNNVDHYLEMLMHDQPHYVLGLGMYSGRDQDQIRIETVVKNQFRNGPISDAVPIDAARVLHQFLPLLDGVKVATGLGNSWCNLISWKIMELITAGTLKSQYSFLHIPKGFSIKQGAEIIDHMCVSIGAKH